MNWPVRRRVLLGVGAALPLLVAAVVLLTKPWVPVLDMAMTELRVRDVGGRHTPLVGLPGRIGDFPDQGSHPGPWSFYLVAPFYRLAGSTAWGMELASVVINTVSVVLLVVMGHRRLGWRGAVVFAAIGAIAIRGYGLTVLTHPWNPYFPVVLWLVALVATWCVLVGDRWWAPVATAASVIAAQTHVPYLVSAIALNVLVVGALAWQWRRRQPAAAPALLATLGTALVLWIPPFAEQLRHGDDGNIAKLIDHFGTEQEEAAIGVRAAFGLLTQHFDLVALGWDLLARDDAFVHRAGRIDDGTSVVGLLVLVAWCAAAVWAWRRRHRPLLALHLVAATTAVAGLASISRIFGKVWFYLTLWMSGTVLLVALTLAWTVWVVASERVRSLDRRLAPAIAVALGAIATVASLAAVGLDVPEDDLAEDVRHVMPEVTAALDADVGAATGKDGSYVVFWQESVVPGSQGYALMNELERRGYEVGVHPTWRVPATAHRVRDAGEYTAEVHLVSGAWIDEWRERPGHVLVVEYDDRDTEQLARFAELEARVIDRLNEIGRPELVDEFQHNIFGTSLRSELPADISGDLAEMLLLGEPIAVFIAPPGSTF